jgi:hypothetical protein
MTLSPNDFPCIEDYLSMFKIFILLCIHCKIDLKDDLYIYVILDNIGSTYYVFVSTFYATNESLWSAYKEPSLGSFCDSLIQWQDKLVQLGLINIEGTSNKALVAQQKDKSKNPKKKHPHHNNKKNKGTKPCRLVSTPNGGKGEKSESKKIGRHCNFHGKDAHVEYKCFKNMEALETTMKKNSISIDSSC